MIGLLLLLQTNAATPRVSAGDSASLRGRVENAQFLFMMDWRYLWQTEMRNLTTVRLATPQKPPANYYQVDIRAPTGGCTYESNTRRDADTSVWAAHLIKAPGRIRLSLCPAWYTPRWYEPADERKSIDASLNIEGFPPIAADSARLIRAAMIRTLDSAAKRLPGDPWIAGQRVRLKLDQQDVGGATRAANECQADFWWCISLLAYAQHYSGDLTAASLTFDKARPLMPDSVRCAWDDTSLLLPQSVRQTYSKLSCKQRDSVNARVWWLADPLYVENGNERRTEHYARRVLIELHRALEIDERFDWRDDYQGPAVAEMVMRYGWPSQIMTANQAPERWRRGNIKSLFLGDAWITVPWGEWCDGLVPDGSALPFTPIVRSQGCEGPRTINAAGARIPVDSFALCIDETFRATRDSVSILDFPCNRAVIVPGTRYWGPQFATLPHWETVLDPFHATDLGWDLAPRRDDVGPYWDTSWWPSEFYRRDAGPLVPLMSQHAFFRRQATAILAANMQWDTVAFLTKPLDKMVAATIITKGPNLPLAGAKDTMSGKSPRPLVSQVPSGPALLAIEMIPRAGTGPAARTRFGVDVPQPLSALKPGELALSDIVLARAGANESLIESMVALMPRMLGSTVLREPARVALFWELYGLGTGDTVDVSLRIIKKKDANSVQQLGAILGIGSAADDSVVQTWREPRSGDPMATMDGNISIRPRSIVIDMSALPAARYSVELQVKRGAQPPAISKREFRIERR